MSVHEDERRILQSYPEAKMITAKCDSIIGKHYHKIKTEFFILTSGECSIHTELGIERMERGKLYTMLPNTYHEFHIKKGSVLVGINSHHYDPSDDYTK